MASRQDTEAFESSKARREGEPLPDARLRAALALVLGATTFGSLWAMADEGPKWAARPTG
jgi:hypothetical protein